MFQKADRIYPNNANSWWFLKKCDFAYSGFLKKYYPIIVIQNMPITQNK